MLDTCPRGKGVAMARRTRSFMRAPHEQARVAPRGLRGSGRTARRACSAGGEGAEHLPHLRRLVGK